MLPFLPRNSRQKKERSFVLPTFIIAITMPILRGIAHSIKFSTTPSLWMPAFTAQMSRNTDDFASNRPPRLVNRSLALHGSVSPSAMFNHRHNLPPFFSQGNLSGCAYTCVCSDTANSICWDLYLDALRPYRYCITVT